MLRDLVEAHFTCKTQGKLISIKEVDLEQFYNTMFWKRTQICISGWNNISHSINRYGAVFICWEKYATFLEILQNESFLIKTKLDTSLPGK